MLSIETYSEEILGKEYYCDEVLDTMVYANEKSGELT